MKIAYSEVELPQVAKQIVKELKYSVCLVNGQMGAGKTTLIKVICNALGVSQNMSSPTYAIVNDYEAEDGKIIHHFDLYRLKNTEELLDIGFEEYLDSGNLCFIEWPALAHPLLPTHFHQMDIVLLADGKREIGFVVG